MFLFRDFCRGTTYKAMDSVLEGKDTEGLVNQRGWQAEHWSGFGNDKISVKSLNLPFRLWLLLFLTFFLVQ